PRSARLGALRLRPAASAQGGRGGGYAKPSSFMCLLRLSNPIFAYVSGCAFFGSCSASTTSHLDYGCFFIAARTPMPSARLAPVNGITPEITKPRKLMSELSD